MIVLYFGYRPSLSQEERPDYVTDNPPHIAPMLGKIAAIFLFPFSALMIYYGETFTFYKHLPIPWASFLQGIWRRGRKYCHRFNFGTGWRWVAQLCAPAAFSLVLMLYKRSCSQGKGRLLHWKWISITPSSPFLSMVQQPLVGKGLLSIRLYGNTQTHHTR
jgi:hypothetical protein